MKRAPSPQPKRPFRDSALIYASFAIVFVIIIFGTGGNLIVALPVAAGCFVLATAYSWWRIRQRLNAEGEDA
jgi:heme O synthase-like polyprenyltransferase